MGIPFDFAASPQVAKPTAPKPVTRVHAIKERAALEIVFPRVSGYRRDLPSEKLEAAFTEDSRLEITPADIGPTSVRDGRHRRRRRRPSRRRCWSGCGPRRSASTSPSICSTRSSATTTAFRSSICSRRSSASRGAGSTRAIWSRKGVPIGAILYQDQLARAAEKIDIALHARRRRDAIVAVLDPYNPKGSTRFVNFITSKPCWKTGAQPPKCHISHVVLDSELGGSSSR